MEDGILSVRYTGYVSAALVERVYADAKRVLDGRTDITGWLIDTTAAKTFAFAPSAAIQRVFELWRAHGGRKFAVVAVADFLRMMGTALRFAKVGPVQIFGDQASALHFLRVHRATPGVTRHPAPK